MYYGSLALRFVVTGYQDGQDAVRALSLVPFRSYLEAGSSPVIETVTIYHNPRCSKSRQTLALLGDQGIVPTVVEYLTNPPDERTVGDVLKKLGIPAAQLIREKEYDQLGLPETDDESELIARMAAHPEIIQRPVVVCGSKARIGRPPEAVLEIL